MDVGEPQSIRVVGMQRPGLDLGKPLLHGREQTAHMRRIGSPGRIAKRYFRAWLQRNQAVENGNDARFPNAALKWTIEAGREVEPHSDLLGDGSQQPRIFLG